MSRWALALILVVLTPPLALAQEAPCAKRSDFLRHLMGSYRETPVARGITGSGAVLEVVASSSGSWTILVTNADGIACGIAAGQEWHGLSTLAGLGPSP
jgi:hypothetical protein